MLTVEQGPIGGYDLIASSRDGGVVEVIGHFGSRGEASAAKSEVQKTGALPKPAPQPFRKRDVRVTDLRVIERQEREREHAAREQKGAFDRATAPKSTLAAAGRLPKPAKPAGPVLKSSERSVIDAVRKRNAAGLLYHADAFKPSILAILLELERRGFVIQPASGKFYLPEFASELARLLRNKSVPPPPPTVDGPPAVRLSGYEKRRMKKTPLPKSIEPSSARVGDRVSVFNYGESEPEHATITALPGAVEHGHVAREPSVLFAPASSQPGMNRYISWDRMFRGWLDPNVNWEPWRR